MSVNSRLIKVEQNKWLNNFLNGELRQYSIIFSKECKNEAPIAKMGRREYSLLVLDASCLNHSPHISSGQLILCSLICWIYRFEPKQRIDESECYTLDGIRNSLIRQEDSIIFGLVERAQFCFNGETYDPNAFSVEGFSGSLIEYMLKKTEKLHATVCF